MRTRRGVTLIEVMVVGIVMFVIAGGLLQVFTSVHAAHQSSQAIPDVQQQVTALVNELAAAIRQAQICPTGAACVADAAVSSAGTNSISLYSYCTSAGCETILYEDIGGQIMKVWESEDIIAHNTNIQFQYYTSPEYTSTSSTFEPVENPALAEIIAVEVSATTSRDGITATYTTVVRLRNAPRKTGASF
jgi:type II secretory pathway component PulJ